MELYFGTANVAGIECLVHIFPITSVIINPNVVVANKEFIWNILPRPQNVIGEKGILFVRTMGRDAQGVVEEAKRLSNAVLDLVVKTPATSEGPAAAKMLKKGGVITLRTAVYSTPQRLLVVLAGARYIAPYVNCTDAQGGDGICTAQELQTLLELHTPDGMVLATSSKTPRQTLDCLPARCETVTLPPDVAQ